MATTRVEPTLIIQCGNAKGGGQGEAQANALYSGSLWQTFRQIRVQEGASFGITGGWPPERGSTKATAIEDAVRRYPHRVLLQPHPSVNVYVLSAKYGLVYETDTLRGYDHRLVKADVDALAAYIQHQQERDANIAAHLQGSVFFVGSELYAAVLRSAGVGHVNIGRTDGVMDRRVNGIGAQRSALKRFLMEYTRETT